MPSGSCWVSLTPPSCCIRDALRQVSERIGTDRPAGGSADGHALAAQAEGEPVDQRPPAASMTLWPTPTVTQDDAPSVVSISTRVIASVPWPWSRMRTL